jgi:hydroxypyruvate isomerase
VKRREFVASAMTVGLGGLVVGASNAPAAASRKPFRLNYAPHFGMFRHHAGDDPIAQLQFMADEGFIALEDNGMAGRTVDEQARIASELSRLKMTMGVFVVNMKTAWSPSLGTGHQDARQAFLEECRSAVDVARRVNARWMTVVLGTLDPRLELEYQNANVIDSLRLAAEIFEPHDLIMVLEPLNHRRDHPGLLLERTSQAFMICRAVNSPSCKILYDAYHQQITEGNLIPNIDQAWNEIAYIQVGDNPGRCEPTTGEIDYRSVFAHLHRKGYAGIVGMEHGNRQPGREGERAVIDAYRRCDPADA